VGKLNFRAYLISRLYPTREICENLMHAKDICFTVMSPETSFELLADTIGQWALLLLCSDQRWNRVSGSRVTRSVILAGSGRVTGQCVRPGV